MVQRVRLPIQTFIQKIVAFAINKLQAFKDWATKNWEKYVFYKDLFFVVYLPFWILIIYASSGNGLVYLLLFLVGIFALGISLFVDSQSIIIAEGDPKAFVLAERHERNFNRYANIISIITIAYAYSAFPIVWFLRNNPQTKNASLPVSFLYPFAALVFVMFSGLIPQMINSFEATIMKQARIARPNWHIPEYFPTERIRASARFTVVSKLLPCSPSRQPLKQFSLFKDGIEIYSEHIKAKYGMVLDDPDRFYKQVKLKAFFTDESDKIKEGIESLIDLLHNNNEQPFAFVKVLKQMLNEPISNDDVCKDVEIDTRRFKRWLTKHHDLTKDVIGPLIFAIIPIVISFFIGLHFA